jgi:hypothetical protein
VTGRMIAIQIKDGDSFFKGKETEDGTLDTSSKDASRP